MLVTSPGRQAANGDELLARLDCRSGRARCGCSPPQEEGRLAFLGALAAIAARRGPADRRLRRRRRLVAGRGRHPPRRRGLGALDRHRLDAPHEPAASTTTRPATRPSQAARVEVDRILDGFLPPLPEIALAVGGSARALRSIVGADARRRRARRGGRDPRAHPGEGDLELYDVDLERVRTLAAGAVILERAPATAPRPAAGRPRGGVREGAAIELAASVKAA